jgi:dTDP-4-amino-4,6-dideoxygalactose transaminase
MKISRVRVYLSIFSFVKSFLISRSNSRKYVEEILKKKLNKKKIFFSGMSRTSYLLVLDYLKFKFPNKNEIILCSYNLPEMVNLTILKGFKIRMVDINIETGVMDENKFNDFYNENTAALLYTNMFNDKKNLIDVKKFCVSKKILFIEDNAIYLGNYSDKEGQKEYAGSFGDVSLLSFGIMKNYNSLFGGACLTSLDDLSEFIEIREKSLKNFGIMDYINKLALFIVLKLSLSSYIYNLFFFKLIKLSEFKNIKLLKNIFYPALKFKVKNSIPNNYKNKIPNFCYSILLEYLKPNEKNNLFFDVRKTNNNLYFNELFNQNGISLIKIKDKDFQNFLDFPILIHHKKKQLVNYLFNNGLEVRTHFYSNCERIFNNNLNNNSEIYENNIICLPSHSLISKDKILQYCKHIKLFLNKI